MRWEKSDSRGSLRTCSSVTKGVLNVSVLEGRKDRRERGKGERKMEKETGTGAKGREG